MKYLVLIYGNPASREIWEGMTDEQRSTGLDAYRALNDELDASGERIVSGPLADPALTRRLPATETLFTDGPFAEVKELLAGFYLLECDSFDRAVEVAGKVPEAAYGLVEVRPLMDLSAFEP